MYIIIHHAYPSAYVYTIPTNKQTNKQAPNYSDMSSGVVIAAAMVVSSTVIFLAFSRQKVLPSPNPTLRSCLSSDEKKKERKKKKVHFAENVKETSGNGKEYRRQQERKSAETAAAAAAAAEATRTTEVERICRNDMPANRIALYNGILRDRVHRMQCSY